jgi:hypothetical protein
MARSHYRSIPYNFVFPPDHFRRQVDGAYDHFSKSTEFFYWCRRSHFSTFRDFHWWKGVVHDIILVLRTNKGLIDVTRARLHSSFGVPYFALDPQIEPKFYRVSPRLLRSSCGGTFLPPPTTYCPIHSVECYWLNALASAWAPNYVHCYSVPAADQAAAAEQEDKERG